MPHVQSVRPARAQDPCRHSHVLLLQQQAQRAYEVHELRQQFGGVLGGERLEVGDVGAGVVAGRQVAEPVVQAKDNTVQISRTIAS